MGQSSSKQHTPECLSLERLKSLDTLSIHRVEAEYVYRAMHRGWYGYGPRNAVNGTPPPASPLYDSGDDEPAEPSSVINALAVTVPPMRSQQLQSVTSSSNSSRMRRTRSAGLCPASDQSGILQAAAAAAAHPHDLLARTASAAAAITAAEVAAVAASTSSSRSSGILRRSGSGSSNSSSGSSRHGHGRGSSSRRRTAEDVLQHAPVVPASKAVRFAGAHRTAGGTIVLPLSSAALTAANKTGHLLQQDLSLVTNRASNVDTDLQPLHHLHLMQQRRHTQHHATHHQHHRQRQQQQITACAQLQVHSDGWYLSPMGKLAEIAAS